MNILKRKLNEIVLKHVSLPILVVRTVPSKTELIGGELSLAIRNEWSALGENEEVQEQAIEFLRDLVRAYDLKHEQEVGHGYDANTSELISFNLYCEAHPEERFWQALRNWSGYYFVYGVKEGGKIEDTFYR